MDICVNSANGEEKPDAEEHEIKTEQPNLTDQQRQFQSGLAFGLLEFISHVKSIRARAREASEARAEAARQKLDRDLKARAQG